MSNIVPISKTNLPAHLRKAAEGLKQAVDEALGGIKGGGFARLSISGSKFHFVKGGEAKLITDPRDATKRDPLMRLPVVVAKANPALSKQFYEKGYTPGATDEPDCASDDGLTPNAGVPKPQAKSCANCPHNVWGSRLTPGGKKAKACSDNKRVALVPENDLGFEPIALAITPAALSDWGNYVKELGKADRPVYGVVTELSFDASADFPKLLFTYKRDLTAEEYQLIEERRATDEFDRIVNPKEGFVPGTETPTQATEPVVPLEQNHKPAETTFAFGGGVGGGAAEPAAKTAEPAAEASDPFAGLPAHVALAVNSAGGLDTEAGRDIFVKLGGKLPEPPADEKPVADPFAGVPEHIKAAVIGAGGLDTEAGRSVFKALVPTTPAPLELTPAPETPKKGRAKKAAEPAPTPKLPETGTTPTLSTAPPTNVVPPGGKINLSDALNKALKR